MNLSLEKEEIIGQFDEKITMLKSQLADLKSEVSNFLQPH
jgi:hypothetical protein